MLLDGLDDVSGSQVEGFEPVGIQPDAHAVILGTEDRYISHAFDTQQFILDPQYDVIVDKQAIVAIFRRAYGDKHQDVGRALLDGHPLAFDLFGQFGLGGIDPVLNQYL